MTLLPRGVHRCPVLSSDGNPVVISIDHQHREVQRRVILPGENPISVVALLWEHLDTIDPEHSRRALTREQAASVAMFLCSAFALEKLALLLL